jgi:hypothetical protein
MDETKKLPEVIDEVARTSMRTINTKFFDYTTKADHVSIKFEELLTKVKELETKLAAATLEKPESDKLDILYTALAAAKKDMVGKAPERNAQGQRDTGNKSYAKVDAMRSFVDEHLAPHGLAFTMDPITKENIDYLRCTLSHTSGQFKSWYKETRTYTEVGWQAYSKALTYDKRVIYGAVFGIDSGSVADEQEMDKEELSGQGEQSQKKVVQNQAVQMPKKPFNPTSF